MKFQLVHAVSILTCSTIRKKKTLEIQLSWVEGRDPINWFNSAIILCRSGRVSNGLCEVFFFFFIKVLVPSYESEWSFICVRGVDFASFDDFPIDFWKSSNSVVFFVFHFIFLPFNLIISNLINSFSSGVSIITSSAECARQVA